MAYISNSFESTPSGAALSTTNSGSGGGTGDDAFEIVSTSGANVAPTVVASRAAHGSKSMEVATGATAGSSYVGWTEVSLGAASTIHFRANLYFTAYTAASTNLFRIMSGTTVSLSVGCTSAGVLRVISATNATVPLSTAFPLNQWFRLEGKFTAGASNGTCELRRYDTVDAATGSASDTVVATGQSFTAGFDGYRFGLQTSAANFGPIWYDDIALSTTAFIGPAGTAVTPPASGVPANTAAPTISGTPQAGATLTSTTGTWTNSPTSYTRQWKANGANIAGETGTTFVPTTGHVGQTITVTVTASNATGAGAAATSTETAAITAAGAASTLAYWFENPNKTIPSGASYYRNSGSLASAITAAGTNGTLVLDYDGTRVEDINMALPSGVTITNAPGKRPWVDGTVRFSGGENVKIYGLSVKWTSPAAGAHMVYWDGGSGQWGYSEFTIPGSAGCYTLVRPGQTIHDWRIHHCWIHDNPGVTSHDGNQDHGLYCSAEDATQNGRIDHCLIEDMPLGRNIKIGGPSGGGGTIGDIEIDHCTLRLGYGPSNGQVSNGTANTTWHHNLLIDSGRTTSLTEGSGAGSGSSYSFNKSDRTAGPATANFRDAGNNVNNVGLSLLSDYAAQGQAGYGHLEGATSGSTTTNVVPTANAGTNQTNVAAGATVTLTGSGTDPDGTIVSYSWTQTGGPTIALSGSGATRTFTAPSVVGGATLSFSLVVTDNVGATSPADTVSVTVLAPTAGNVGPTANAGATQSNIAPGTTVTLTGSGTDPDGTITAYTWTQTGGPTVQLDGTGATRTFTAPTVTGGATLSFSLTVTDNGGIISAPASTSVTVNAPGSIGTATRFMVPQKVAATATTATSLLRGRHTPVNATSGALTMGLPVGSTEGVTVSAEKVDSSTNTVTLLGNIRGVANATLTLLWQYDSVTLRADAQGSWWPVAGHRAKEALDSAYGKSDANAFYTNGTWPTRASVTTDTTRRVRWIGPAATPPTIGGAYAINGFDVIETTT